MRCVLTALVGTIFCKREIELMVMEMTGESQVKEDWLPVVHAVQSRGHGARPALLFAAVQDFRL